MKLKEYIDGLKGKRITVLGIGVSNTPLIELLLDHGCDITACDKSERVKLGPLAEELERRGNFRTSATEIYRQRFFRILIRVSLAKLAKNCCAILW